MRLLAIVLALAAAAAGTPTGLEQKTPVRDAAAIRRATIAAGCGNPAQRRKLVKIKEALETTEVVAQKVPARSVEAVRRATRAAILGSPAQRRKLTK